MFLLERVSYDISFSPSSIKETIEDILDTFLCRKFPSFAAGRMVLEVSVREPRLQLGTRNRRTTQNDGKIHNALLC